MYLFLLPTNPKPGSNLTSLLEPSPLYVSSDEKTSFLWEDVVGTMKAVPQGAGKEQLLINENHCMKLNLDLILLILALPSTMLLTHHKPFLC